MGKNKHTPKELPTVAYPVVEKVAKKEKKKKFRKHKKERQPESTKPKVSRIIKRTMHCYFLFYLTLIQSFIF